MIITPNIRLANDRFEPTEGDAGKTFPGSSVASSGSAHEENQGGRQSMPQRPARARVRIAPRLETLSGRITSKGDRGWPDAAILNLMEPSADQSQRSLLSFRFRAVSRVAASSFHLFLPEKSPTDRVAEGHSRSRRPSRSSATRDAKNSRS